MKVGSGRPVGLASKKNTEKVRPGIPLGLMEMDPNLYQNQKESLKNCMNKKSMNI